MARIRVAQMSMVPLHFRWTKLIWRFLLLGLALALTACTGAPRYVVESPAATERIRLPIASLEVKDLVLPGHASGAEVLIETPDGALAEIGGAIWADDPVRAHTATLASALESGSNAIVAAEPWPLFDPAQAEVMVRIDRMLARADGTFDLDAQVAITSRDDDVREQIKRFSLKTPLPSADAAGVAKASGTSLRLLADRILALLAN